MDGWMGGGGVRGQGCVVSIRRAGIRIGLFAGGYSRPGLFPRRHNRIFCKDLPGPAKSASNEHDSSNETCI